jgi:putative ABC transport system permease protein
MSSPPKLAKFLLRLLSSQEKDDAYFGDIEEIFSERFEQLGLIRAKRWYWREVVKAIPRIITESVRWRSVMFMNYLKIAVRNMKRHEGYSAINIIGLAIGITCCLYIFLHVQQELSYDRYHEDAGRIYRIACRWEGEAVMLSLPLNSFPVADVIKERYSEVESIGRLGRRDRVLIRYGDKVFYENGLLPAEPEIFDIFHIPLLKGGPIGKLAQPNTIILTERMAEKYLGSEDPIGKSIQINNADFEIIGVVQNAPVNTHLYYDFIASIREFYTEEEMRAWTLSRVYTYVKLVAGTDVDTFGSKIRSLSDSFLGKDFPFQRFHLLQPVTGIHLNSRLLYELKPPGNKAYILIFSAVGLLILLIACLNFINLATAISVHRSREVGMRRVIGAQRSQIIRQFLLESSLIALSAVVLSVGLTYLSMPYFMKAFSMEIMLTDVLRPTVFLMLLGCTLLIGVGAGSYPAFFLSRFNPVPSLKGAKGGAVRSRSRLRQALVVLQFAISVGLIISTLVMYKQIDYMKNASLGFDKQQKLIIPATGVSLKEKYQTVKSEYLSHALVSGVTVSSSVPGREIESWGVHKLEQTEEYAVDMKHFFIDEDFLPEYGIELSSGRNFRGYRAADAQACLLNEAAVKFLGWASAEEALGQKLVVGPEDNVETVIGVIRDFHFQGLQSVIEPQVLDFVDSQWFHLNIITLNVYTSDLKEVLVFAEKTWNKLFPGRPFEYSFLDEDFNRLYITEDVRSRIFGVFALLGLFVACLGLLGLASFAAEQRTKEIGIRKMLGASVSGIVLMLSREFTKWVVIANAVAFPVVYFVMSQWLQNFAYRTSIPLWVFILSALSTLVLALITVFFQAIKAATANPVDSLRYE